MLRFRGRSLRGRAGLLALAVACAFFTGCRQEEGITWSSIYTPAPAAAAVTEKPSDRDYLKVAMPTSSGAWDPAINTSQTMQGLMQLSFETPVRLDNALKPQEQLVSWSSSPDGVTWTFTVREGVYFHDGSPMTAADIVKSLDRILTVGKDGPFGWVLSQLTAWRMEDERTLIVTGSSGGYATLYAMVFPVMKMQGEGYPVGTGAYRLTAYEPGESLSLIAQDNWWRTTPQITSIQAVARESAESEMATFLGDIDIARTRSVTATQYRESGVSTTHDFMTQGYDALFFNFQRPMMADLGIRNAIAMSIDRQDIIANIYQNHAVASDLPIPPDSWLHEARLTAPGYDAALAFQSLENMGFQDVDGDGLFDQKPTRFRALPEDAQEEPGGAETSALPLTNTQPPEGAEEDPLAGLLIGEQLSPAARSALLEPLELLTNYDKENPVRRDAALRIAGQLQKAGFSVNVTAVPLEELSERLESGEYDLVLLGYQIPLSCSLEFLLSTQYEGEQAGHSVTHFSDPTLEALLAGPYRAADDVSYQQATQAVGERILSQLPFVGLYFRTGTLALRENLRTGVTVREERPYRGIENWYFVEMP